MNEVTKDDRVLLVVANLVLDDNDPANQAYRTLYEWLDRFAVSTANLLMRPLYRRVVSLKGDQVKQQTFVERVVDLASDPQTKALDVILVMHGSPGRLYFDDGSITSAQLGEQLRAEDLAGKLRLLYSTACYGISHAQDFVDAGFRTACGAKRVCANGPYEFPTQLLWWGSGATYKSTVRAGNNEVFLLLHDHAAKLLFDDVDSEKVIVGKKYTRITTPAA